MAKIFQIRLLIGLMLIHTLIGSCTCEKEITKVKLERRKKELTIEEAKLIQIFKDNLHISQSEWDQIAKALQRAKEEATFEELNQLIKNIESALSGNDNMIADIKEKPGWIKNLHKIFLSSDFKLKDENDPTKVFLSLINIFKNFRSHIELSKKL